MTIQCGQYTLICHMDKRVLAQALVQGLLVGPKLCRQGLDGQVAVNGQVLPYICKQYDSCITFHVIYNITLPMLPYTGSYFITDGVPCKESLECYCNS